MRNPPAKAHGYEMKSDRPSGGQKSSTMNKLYEAANRAETERKEAKKRKKQPTNKAGLSRRKQEALDEAARAETNAGTPVPVPVGLKGPPEPLPGSPQANAEKEVEALMAEPGVKYAARLVRATERVKEPVQGRASSTVSQEAETTSERFTVAQDQVEAYPDWLPLPNPPMYFNRECRDLWKNTAEMLRTFDLLRVTDLMALEQYVSTMYQWREAAKECQEVGMTSYDMKTETTMASASAKLMQTLSSQLTKLQDVLGLTMAARKRAGITQMVSGSVTQKKGKNKSTRGVTRHKTKEVPVEYRQLTYGVPLPVKPEDEALPAPVEEIEEEEEEEPADPWDDIEDVERNETD